MIPFKKINLGNSYREIKPLFDSGKIGLGEVTTQFEMELAAYVKAKYALAVNSCTSALYISLLWDQMHGLNKVSIPSMTQALVPMAIMQAGLDFEFNDDTEWVGDRYQIQNSFVMDSAHRLQRDDFEDLNPYTKLCYSFYPTKVIGSIDGGAIVTDDGEFIKWARSFIMYGRNQEASFKNSWEYDVEMIGGKYNYNDVQSAICLEQLRRLDKTNKKRQEIARAFNLEMGFRNNSNYLYRVEIADRDLFIEYMAERGIECGVHFKPLHLFKPFKDVPVKNKHKIETAYARTASLPFYEGLTKKEIAHIADSVFQYELTGGMS